MRTGKVKIYFPDGVSYEEASYIYEEGIGLTASSKDGTIMLCLKVGTHNPTYIESILSTGLFSPPKGCKFVPGGLPITKCAFYQADQQAQAEIDEFIKTGGIKCQELKEK